MVTDTEPARLGRNFTMHLFVALVHCVCQGGLGAIKLSHQIPTQKQLCGSFTSRWRCSATSAIRKLQIFFWMEPSSFLADFIALLKVWTNRSVKPFVFGWYGDEIECRTPFNFINLWNSSATNCGQLSLIKCSGSPFLEFFFSVCDGGTVHL